MPRVRVSVLGPFETLVGGRPVQITSERLRSLLAVLAMSVPERLTAEVLGQRIWGDAPPAHVRRSVQTLVARLRRLLGEGTVASDGTGYQLLTDPSEVDALRFGRLLDEAAVAPDETMQRELLEEALSLWRGAPFEGIRADWLQESAAHPLQERYLSAVERRIDLDLANEQHRTLVAELRELTARYPLRESLWTRLLVVLERSGRPAEALAAYDAIRSRLAAELGVDPGKELRQIHSRLLAADAGSAPAMPVPRQLPSDVPHFTGRADALATLDELLAVPRGLATIGGAGGTGKTALAVHWAHRVRDRFGDGQLYLNLRGYGPGEPLTVSAALDSLLRGLGVPVERIPGGVEARAELFRGRIADRRMLILLDNARDADQVRPLLPATPSTVVVTSRSRLRGLASGGATRGIDLDVLSPREAVALLARLLPARDGLGELARLYGLAELARLCGHLPLALVIAAERAGRDPEVRLGELVAEIHAERHRLDAFESDDDPAVSVRAVFSWSYRALDAEAARMFRLLAVHPGPDIGRAAAAALAGISAPAAGRLLSRLVDRHLVEERRPGRYELHDLLRRYASELAGDDPADKEAALRRGVDWYVHSAVAARSVMRRRGSPLELDEPAPGVQPLAFGDGATAMRWLYTERAVLLAIAREASARTLHTAVCGLAEAMRAFPEFWHVDDLVGTQQMALESARLAGDLTAEALARSGLGGICRSRQNYAGAIDHSERALRLFESTGDENGVASVLSMIALVLVDTGRTAEAVGYHERVLEIARRLGQRSAEANELNNLAVTLIKLGDHGRAVEVARTAIELCRQIGHALLEPYALDTLGQAYVGLGRDDEAVACYQQAMTQCRDIGDRWNELLISRNLGIIWSRLGAPGAARTCFLHALRLFDELGVGDAPEITRAEILARLDDQQ